MFASRARSLYAEGDNSEHREYEADRKANMELDFLGRIHRRKFGVNLLRQVSLDVGAATRHHTPARCYQRGPWGVDCFRIQQALAQCHRRLDCWS